MENMESTQKTEVQVSVNQEIMGYLLEISKWGKFLAIVGYIGIGFLILAAFGVIIGGSFLSGFSDFEFPMGIFGVLYLVIAVLYFFPVNYLYRFSGQIRQGLNSNDQQSVTSGFGNLKSLFKFMGIFTIVMLSIYALALIVVLPLSLLLIK
jgi:hypothetical protein